MYFMLKGVDQRQRDRVGRRRGVLPSLQRHHIGSQRGQRSSVHEATGPNHVTERTGHQTAARNPQRPGRHSEDHASVVGRSHRVVGHQSRTGRNVSLPPCEMNIYLFRLNSQVCIPDVMIFRAQ